MDIGASDVYVNTCKTFDPTLPATVPAGFVDNLGPIQAMTIAVPTSSTATNISAEAAYMVFGFDAATTATTINPWNVPGDIFVRYYDSGTLEMIGKAIGLDGGSWKNATTTPAPAQQQGSGSALAGAIATKAMSATDVDPTIGILSSSSLTTSVRPLAFQATGQTCSYLPDSTSSHTTTDKINVRQGRYDIWGPEHLVTPVDGTGNIKGSNGNTAAVQAAITMAVSSSKALPSQSDAGVPEAGVSPLDRGRHRQVHHGFLGRVGRVHPLVRDGGAAHDGGRSRVFVRSARRVQLPLRGGQLSCPRSRLHHADVHDERGLRDKNRYSGLPFWLLRG